MTEEEWKELQDNCTVCHGAKGGVRGNENIVNGVVMCDYCSVEKQSEDRRIYVVVPETIQVDRGYMENAVPMLSSIKMVPGRLMAQCAHVVSKMRWNEDVHSEEWSPITTIVLSVRNTRELEKVFYELVASRTRQQVYPFYDTNYDVYGTRAPQLTAFCTNPVLKADVDAALGHLELYS